MSNEYRTRDERGQFTEDITEQGILKLFDRADDPFLTAPEIANEFGVTRQGVAYRLKQMREKGHVDSKKAGAKSIGWWATVAPAPSDETLRDIEASEGELEREETVSMNEMGRKIAPDEDGETA